MKLAPGNTSLRCDYCKLVVAVESDDTGVQFLEEAPEQTCPTCSAPLWKSVLAAVELDACKTDRGLLVPMGDFEVLVEKMRALHTEREIPGPMDDAELERKVMCPRCHQRMDTHYYAGPGNVILDSCTTCFRVWLDRGELTRIAHAPSEDDAAEDRW